MMWSMLGRKKILTKKRFVGQTTKGNTWILRLRITLAMTISSGRAGLTNSNSIVPRSFSLAMLMEVISAQIKIKITPMMPGTKL